MQEETKVKSIEWYELNRPEHYSFVRDKIEKCKKHAIISMGVKVGKKEVVLIQNRRTISKPETVRHVFLTNFKRNDCKEQREQLKSYDIDTFYCDELELSVAHIRKLIQAGVEVVVHVDESDYGSGSKMKMATTFKAIRAIKDYVKLRLYSATNEEAIYSEFAGEADLLEMSDPPSFFGPDDFLDANLVSEAEPFWDGKLNKLSPQGEDACKYWIEETNKPFSLLRIVTSRSKNENGVTYKKLKSSKKFREELALFGIKTYFVDGNNGFYWGKAGGSTGGNTWELLDKKSRILIVINQTCVRSTEVGFHPLIAFWHDYRPKSSAYNTVSQAQLRPVFYPYGVDDQYWIDPSVKIKVYGCVDTYKMAAKRITPDEYVVLSGRKMSGRVSSESNLPVEVTYVVHPVPSGVDPASVISKNIYDPNNTGQGISRISKNVENNVAKSLLQGSKNTESPVVFVDAANTTEPKHPTLDNSPSQKLEWFNRIKDEKPEWVGNLVERKEKVIGDATVTHSAKNTSMYNGS